MEDVEESAVEAEAAGLDEVESCPDEVEESACESAKAKASEEEESSDDETGEEESVAGPLEVPAVDAKETPEQGMSV